MGDWTAERVLGLARGFTEPRILMAAAELDVFTPLSGEMLTAAELAGRLGADPRALTMLLDALSAMGLLVKQAGAYACPDDVAAWLSADSPESVLPMVLHSASMWRNWGGLTEKIGGPAARRDDAAREAASRRAFIGAMHVIGQQQAARYVEQIGVGDARSLLDVGGASGTYTIAFLKAAPQMRATLFDRPPVVEMALARLAEAGVLDRVTLAAGDFSADPLPPGHDLALLSAIIHQNSPEQNVDLYRNAYRALVPGGRIVIRDHIMAPDRLSPRAGAIFAINMLAATPGGSTYTFDEIRGGLQQAGFERVRQIAADEQMSGLVEAFRP